jgi:hypothetical protein
MIASDPIPSRCAREHARDGQSWYQAELPVAGC